MSEISRLNIVFSTMQSKADSKGKVEVEVEVERKDWDS
jgi:hypothetical protein